ncbi:MAG: DUF4949 domain-containing protein [Legionella sp.]|uniref:DUF4949 domain-containing protein n=1 Tax=Legionella sp. TaxID=459 RepID=UPI0039E2BB9D
MTFRAKLVAFASALVFAGATFASQENVCPKLGTIQDEGLSLALPIFGNFFAAGQLSNFNMDSIWAFAIAPVEADSEDDAINTGNDILSGMNAPGVVLDKGFCVYDTGNPDTFAVAIEGEMFPIMKIKQYIHRFH